MNRGARSIIAIPLLFAGCGTISNLKTDMVPYGGTGRAVDFALHGNGTLEGTILRPVAAIDAPISLAADTVTLPITVPVVIAKAIARREQEQKALAKKNERERIVTKAPEQNEPAD